MITIMMMVVVEGHEYDDNDNDDGGWIMNITTAMTMTTIINTMQLMTV